jgi:hypothetical protein
VTAVAADETAQISIKNGATDVTNGSSASWSVGENTLTITVTDGNDPQISKVYTVTVTRGE